jgi:hypothetical protein
VFTNGTWHLNAYAMKGLTSAIWMDTLNSDGCWNTREFLGRVSA